MYAYTSIITFPYRRQFFSFHLKVEEIQSLYRNSSNKEEKVNNESNKAKYVEVELKPASKAHVFRFLKSFSVTASVHIHSHPHTPGSCREDKGNQAEKRKYTPNNVRILF